MGLEDSSNRLAQINPSSLIGRADEDVVTPRNAALLADAFRQGFISTDDIMERVSERANLKRKADVMQLQEALAPLAVNARRNSLELANIEAQTGIDLAPLKKKAAEAEFMTKANAAQIQATGLGTAASELQNASWLPPIPAKGIDEKWQNETIRRWGILSEMKKAQQTAAAVQKAANDPKWFQGNFQGLEGQFPKAFLGMKEITPEQAERANQVMGFTHPALWEQAGKPNADLFGAPGEVKGAETVTPKAAAQQAAVEPQAAPASQTVININSQPQPQPQPQAQAVQPFQVAEPPTAPMIEPAAPVAAPGKPDLFAQPAPAGFVPTGVTKPTGRAFSEPQQKALIAEARGLVANPVLESPGFNPGDTGSNLRMKAYNSGTIGELATTLGPGAAKISDPERKYANAQSQWIQGLLRVESGAAISKKEQGWYEKAFFPAVGDSPDVQAQKATARKAILTALESVITGHQSDADYQAMRERIGQSVGAPSTGAPVKSVTVTSREQATQSASDPSVNRVFFGGKTYRRVNQ
jgi:hypothetical protein